MADVCKQFDEDFYDFLEGGFLAVNQTDEDSAIKLFKAAETLRPEDTFPWIGLAYMHLCKLELKQASTLLNQVLAKEPDNEIASSLLGICMGFTPQKTGDGEKILEKMTHSSETEVKKLADLSLRFIDEFIKKSPSPLKAMKDQENKKK